MKITRTVVPSLFTALNIFCGFLAIIFASQGQLSNAAWLIILAALFDSVDGMMARMTHSQSQFGVELDSLADVVSFGAAPSFLVYKVYLYLIGPWGILVAALPVVFGAIRLARFNVQLIGFDKEYFNGLPIPMQAITLCAFVLQYDNGNIGTNTIAGTGLIILVVILSLLMVSRIKYDTMPKVSRLQLKSQPLKFIAIGIAVLLIGFFKLVFDQNILFHLLMLYVLIGLLRAVYKWVKKGMKKNVDTPIDAGKLSSIDI
jgi:CDP-diacylglycerol--serine O-phosphatidyltransferase